MIETSSRLLADVIAAKDPRFEFGRSEEELRDFVVSEMTDDYDLGRTENAVMKLSQSTLDWIDHEKMKNGLEPASDPDDRKNFMMDFEGFVLGDQSDSLILSEESRSQNLPEWLNRYGFDDPEKIEIGRIDLSEAVDRIAHWRADRYNESDLDVRESVLQYQDNMIFRDRLDLLDREKGILKLVKLTQTPERIHDLEAALKLNAVRLEEPDIDHAEVIYPLIPRSEGFNYRGMQDFEEWGHKTTISYGKVSNLLDGRKYDDVLSELDAFLEDVEERTAERLSDKFDYHYPDGIDSSSFIELVSVTEGIEDDLEDYLEEVISEKLAEYSSEISRWKDPEGRRVYTWNGKAAYSVTTILGEASFGDERALEQFKSREYSDTAGEYARKRGDLAHALCFQKFAEPGRFEDEIQNTLEDLRRFGQEELDHILEWKDEERLYLQDSSKDNGFIQNGAELAREELEWIEDQFRNLEGKIGLEKGNVIEVETKVAYEGYEPMLNTDFSLAGKVDMVFEHGETGENVLLDLKTSKGLYNKYRLQSIAYAEAIENSRFIDVPQIDRIMIPVINPEIMRGDEGSRYYPDSPTVYTDKNIEGEIFDTEEFYDVSTIEHVNGEDYPRQRWSENSYREEGMNIIARAASDMPEIDIRDLSRS